MVNLNDIYQFVEKETGIKTNQLQPKSDLCEEFCVYGDDLFVLIESFGNFYGVNIESFLWYFHSPEEASSPFCLLFPQPNKRVSRIPITPELLAEYANTKNWGLDYPTHDLLNKRWDIILLNVFFYTLGVVGILIGLSKLIGG
jgi:hypothetical protein